MANIKFSAFTSGATTGNTKIVGYDSTGNTNNQYTLAELADGLASKLIQNFIIACSDETTALTVGTGKVEFRMPFAFTLTRVKASATTAPVGSTLIVDINEAGTTILSTKLTLDAGEKTSDTAAAAAVISDASLANDSIITIDVDQIGSSTAGAGLKVYLEGYRTG